MIVRKSGARRDAPALRFLLLCVGGWTVLRVAAHWNPAVPPPAAAVPPWSAPSPFVAAGPAAADDAVVAAPGQRAVATVSRDRTARRDALAAVWPEPAATGRATFPGTGGAASRHGLRFAMLVHRLPLAAGGAARSAVGAGPVWAPLPAAARADPGQGKPFWMRRQMAGWSLTGWLYLRSGAVTAPDAIAAAGQLGGSQAGMRVGYGFGASGRARLYGRATLAVRRPEQRELALGLAFAPVAHWPVDVAVEQRIAAGKEGRTALAAMVSGGVADVALPHGFRLEAYGQAGVVGARRRDGFADGAIVVDRRLGSDETSPLRLGALAAGAVQPGAARVDVGPRLTLRLPEVGEGSRIAVDWRQRVAGDASPESGVALTLATDF